MKFQILYTLAFQNSLWSGAVLSGKYGEDAAAGESKKRPATLYLLCLLFGLRPSFPHKLFDFVESKVDGMLDRVVKEIWL